jgi:Sugar diacid utilization regulator
MYNVLGTSDNGYEMIMCNIDRLIDRSDHVIITRELAQKIVDNIMPIVHCNVNIMNSDGIIIGSGQPARINSYHQGAINAILSGDLVEIHSNQIEQFPGAQPGLNWPILLDDQIVGVVGISGKPDAVRNTAQLVKMITELLLERESLLEKFRLNLQLKERMVRLLLEAKYRENYAQITQIANLLRFELQSPRLVAVMRLDSVFEKTLNHYGLHDLIIPRIEEDLIGRLEAAGLVDKNDVYVFKEKELIILKQFPQDSAANDFYLWGHKLFSALNKEQQYNCIKIGLGSLTTTPAELYYSYQEAVFTYQHADADTPVASIYDYDVMSSYLLEVPGAIEKCLALNYVSKIIKSKLAAKYDMANTIRRLLRNNLNVSLAAKDLYIHRNTLVFRLAKLKELTGLSPSQFFNHAVLCKIIFK